MKTHQLEKLLLENISNNLVNESLFLFLGSSFLTKVVCNFSFQVAQEWPGLPKGVKFDPTDQEIIWHLIAKSGAEELKPHPFIDEFIITVDDDEGICCSHPHKLPSKWLTFFFCLMLVLNVLLIDSKN